jgi:hypothetical protein
VRHETSEMRPARKGTSICTARYYNFMTTIKGELPLQLTGVGLADQRSVQKVHGQTTEAQIPVSADCIANVSVRRVGSGVASGGRSQVT